MSRMAMRARSAFSLLEIIIATAILAGSAMVLFSLIGLGTKYGNRAEEQTSALTQAQSVLDEYIANLSDEEIQEGVSGVLNGFPARSYRIEILPFEIAGNSGAGRNNSTSSETQTVLVRVTVAILEGNVSLAGMESEPLCQLSRLVRRPRIDEPAGELSRNVEGGL
ncbi:MAG: type II secretion system protein [Planctomycetota bacterium]|nr:type II secretion system protein [Planctomycetota bacterium]